MKGGTQIAIGLAGGQFFSDVQETREHSAPIMEVGRSILAAIDFSDVDDSS